MSRKLKVAAMVVRVVAAFLMFLGSALPLLAQPADSQAVIAALRLPEMIGVLRDEGIAYGDDLEQELFPAAGGTRWASIVSQAYDRPKVTKRFEAAFSRELGDDPMLLGPIVDFFGTVRGQKIVGLELEARRALLDQATEDAAKVTVDQMRAKHDPRLEQLTRFVTTSDLIEMNVAGALNANLAFYRGLAAGGAFGGQDMTEDNVLAEVWAQEGAIRADTEGWLYAFLALAYGPLSDADMQDYIAFSQTPAAQRLNTALFAAFDTVFATISHDLGLGAAQLLTGQDI